MDILGGIICLGVLLFYFFSGRIIATHTLFGRNYAASGLHNIFSALGVWSFIALIAIAIDIKLNIAWWGFTALTLLSYFYFLSSRHEKLPREHTLTVPLTILLFLAPTLYFVWHDSPTKISELIGFLRNTQYFMQNLTAPNYEASLTYSLKNITAPPAGILSILPIYIFKTSYFASAFAIFNVILLAFVADAMMKLTDINVRWSNLALIAVGTIFSLTVLNPFFSIEALTSAAPDFVFAAGILAAIVPLCREKPLPIGLSSIPMAFILSALINIHTMGVYAVIIILSLWFIRIFLEKKNFVDLFFSLTVLITLPALSWYLWVFYAQDIELTKNIIHFSGIDIFHMIKEIFSPLALLSIISILILWIIEISSIRRFKNVRELFTKNAWLTIPTLFVYSYTIIAIHNNEKTLISHIQFIAVIPFWYIATSWYKNSKWQKFAYESPWGLALSLAVIFMSLQSIASNKLNQRYSAPQQHTLAVANLLAKNTLKDGNKLAILESNDSQLYTAFMRYGLTHYKGQILNVNALLKNSSQNLSIFHSRLKDNNFNYLWVHSPTIQDKEWLGRFLKTDKSYLFKVNENKLSLIRVYPHPSYDYKNL